MIFVDEICVNGRVVFYLKLFVFEKKCNRIFKIKYMYKVNKFKMDICMEVGNEECLFVIEFYEIECN